MAHERDRGRYLQGAGLGTNEGHNLNLGMVVLLGGPSEHPLHCEYRAVA